MEEKNDLNIYASFKASEYTATFKNENGTIDTRTFTVEDATVKNLPEVPKKTGYTGKWEIYTLSTSDITIDAIYTPIDYTISFANTKDAANSNPTTYNIETSTITLENLSKDGYTFEGWFVGDDEVNEIILGSTGDKNLEAKWSLIEYTATFKNGTEVVTTRTFTVEDTVIDDLPTVPAKEYYSNGAWENYEIGANDIEIDAIYTPIEYTISYNNIEGATNSNPTTYNIETETFDLVAPSKDGYTFEGWFIGETEVPEITLGSHGVKALEAKWTPIVYTATFKNGDVVVDTITFTLENMVIDDLPTVPAKDYYTNGAWESYTLSTSDITIDAIYTPIDYTISYTNVTGAINSNLTGYNVDTPTITLINPSKDGYTFEGWFIGEDEVTEITLGSHGDKSLEAKWTPTEYDILYNLDGGTNNASNPTTYNIEDGTILLKNPTKEGKAFNGWKLEEEIGVSFSSSLIKNITLEAIWIDKVGLSYTKDSDNNITITGFVNDDIKSTLRVLEIGDTYDGYNIVGIAEGAFSGCSILESITLPFVGGNVFATDASSTTLFGYIFGINSYTNGIEIKQQYGEKNYEYSTYYIPGSIKSVTITGGNILYGAFYNCASLISVTILDSVESMGDNAFTGCTNLIYSEIENIKYLGNDENPYLVAISVTDKTLSSYNLQSTTKFIYYKCFSQCASLESITIPNSVKSMGNNVFSGCTSLESILLPYSVKSIGNNVFSGCTSLESIILPSSVESIGDKAFSGCTGLKSIKLPDNVERIGEDAFSGCGALEYTVSDNIKYLGNTANPYLVAISVVNKEVDKCTIKETTRLIYHYCFKNCINLYRIEIPNSVITIGKSAFYYCSSMNGIYMPNSVKIIGENAFLYCDSLSKVNYIGTIEEWRSIIFKDNQSNPLCNGASLYLDGDLVENVVISNTITTINDTFYGCTSLKSVTLGNSVESIGVYAFGDCKNLVSVMLEYGVEKIEDSAFNNCTSLESITISDSIESIGGYAFDDCTNITKVKYLGTIEQWCSIKFGGINSNPINNGGKLFFNDTLFETIAIPDTVTTINAYAFNGWTFLKSVTIPASVKSIEERAFLGCTSLVDVAMQNNVKSIEYEAFSGCTSLKSIVLPNSVEKIGADAFKGCTSLESIALPDSIESIGTDAFDGCTNLEYNEIENIKYLGNTDNPYLVAISIVNKDVNSCTISETTKIIYQYCFTDCTDLNGITMSGGVKYIGYNAFKGCTSIRKICYLGTIEQWCKIVYVDMYSSPLQGSRNIVFIYMNDEFVTDIEIPNNITAISDYKFYNFFLLKSITIPDSVESIGIDAFSNCSNLKNVYIENEEIARGIMRVNSFGHLVVYATTIYIEESITEIGSYIIESYTKGSTTTVDGVTYNIYTKNAEA